MNPLNGTETSNWILARLDPAEVARLAPHATLVEVKTGDIQYSPGDKIDHIFFPTTAMASAVGETAEGESAEIGVMGREGVVVPDPFFGIRHSLHKINWQLPGEAYRVPCHIVLSEFDRAGSFQKEVLRSLYRLMSQISRTAMCNALHPIPERLARWLLMCRDRSPDGRLELTQEFLALMVGATRPSVSIAASSLQAAGLIRYVRGSIEIIDRPGLEQLSCDCYRAALQDQPLADAAK